MCRPTTTATSASAAAASVSVVISSSCSSMQSVSKVEILSQSRQHNDETISQCSSIFNNTAVALHKALKNNSDVVVAQHHHQQQQQQHIERHSFFASGSTNEKKSSLSLTKQRRVSFPEGNAVVTSVIYRAYTPIEDREILFYQSNDYIQFKQEFRRLKKQFLEMKLKQKKQQQQQEQEAKAVAVAKAKKALQQQNGDDCYYDDDDDEESLSCMERVMYSLTCKWLTKALQ